MPEGRAKSWLTHDCAFNIEVLATWAEFGHPRTLGSHSARWQRWFCRLVSWGAAQRKNFPCQYQCRFPLQGMGDRYSSLSPDTPSCHSRESRQQWGAFWVAHILSFSVGYCGKILLSLQRRHTKFSCWPPWQKVQYNSTVDFPKNNMILNYLMLKILHIEVVRIWVIFPMESTLL